MLECLEQGAADKEQEADRLVGRLLLAVSASLRPGIKTLPARGMKLLQ
ncbi:hypothetical protein KNP414_05188 [Paenibacillus mucilaginosus KNP414]|uniref:Uncharacterized protein n=1 Tax=Paenibacillus mucilaginosus (strain KNP414) TaxID=1036673 RepID=F8FBV1_PAEMK|nr:hypothetical protein KNP414_05188 [Paenibacillus mucilaginosus KNP414]